MAPVGTSSTPTSTQVSVVSRLPHKVPQILYFCMECGSCASLTYSNAGIIVGCGESPPFRRERLK